MRDERARWSATQLQQHTFVKSPLFLAVRESPEKAVNSSKNQGQYIADLHIYRGFKVPYSFELHL